MTRISTFAIALICGALLLAPACKKKGKDAANKGAEPSAKSSKSNHARLQGEWKFDFERMKTLDPDMKKMKPEQIKEMKGFIEKMSVQVTKDKMIVKFVHKGKPENYKVLSDKGNTLKMESKDEKGKVSKATIVFHNDKSITVTEIDADGKKETIALKR
jgi:hypothetical protein